MLGGLSVGALARLPALLSRAVAGPRERRALRGHPPLPVSSTGRDWATVSPDRSSAIGVGLAGRRTRLVASMSAFHPTRLETRTKESNMRASHWAVRNPKAQ